MNNKQNPSTRPYIGKIDIAELISSPGFYGKYINIIEKTENPKYLHFRDLKAEIVLPEEFDGKYEKFWLLVKFHRRLHGTKIRISDRQNRLFSWQRLGEYERFCYEFDLEKESNLKNFPKKYHQRMLIEEAIASAQLSGSYITTKAAREIFISNRIPKTRAKRMIYNNFKLLQIIDEKYRDKSLNIRKLEEFHKILQNNIENQQRIGQFSNLNDQFVQKEIGKFLIFANHDAPDEHFIHPIIRAIIVHFWFLLLSPFEKGNEQIARALFYWYLFKNGYNIFSILPISAVIKLDISYYSDSFKLSLEDDNNLNYFIDYKIKIIEKTLNSFKENLRQESRKNKALEDDLGNYPKLNERQIGVIELLKNDHNSKLTQSSHRFTYQITKATAISDLKKMEQLGLIEGKKDGRNVFYSLK